jgi:hypothetical protein
MPFDEGHHARYSRSTPQLVHGLTREGLPRRSRPCLVPATPG